MFLRQQVMAKVPEVTVVDSVSLLSCLMSRSQSGPRRRGRSTSASRRKAAREIGAMLEPGMRAALTTHVNPDGDGIGSEVGLLHMLAAVDVRAIIANPSPLPDRYRFLVKGIEKSEKSSDAAKYIKRADVVFVLDISDVGRLGSLGEVVAALKVPVVCIDHHATDGAIPEGPRLVDAEASATGELVYNLARVLGWDISAEAARGLYVAIMTDTGGFRYSNTTSRVMDIAGRLLECGVDPESIYEHVFASASEGRLRLIAEVLSTLVVESDLGLAWVTVPDGALERNGVGPDDLEGVVEFPRSVRGVKLALLFRRLANGRTKVSFRSMGDVDAATLAEEFGGGGHRKAAGASLKGSVAEIQEIVLARARNMLAN